MESFAGVYKFEKDDGKFGDFLKELGVGMVTRTAAVALKPTVTVVVNGDGTCEITTSSTLKTSKIKFKLDEEFDEERADGKQVKTVVRKDGNKLIQEQKGDKPTVFEREFSADGMTLTCKVGSVTCKREYKKQ